MAKWWGSTSPASRAGQTMNKINLRGVWVLGVLAAASLACGGGRPDVEATVNAVSTAVQSTLIAMTPQADATGTTLPPATVEGGATVTVAPGATGTLPPTPTQYVPPTL